VIGLVERLQKAKVKPAGCFVGEPTEMGVIVGHKGKRSLRVTVRGFTVHSSLALRGVNAVEYAARLIVKIREISDRLGREGARDPLYDVPWTTGHTGLVRGGTALNIVPDECSFEFEFRNIAADDADALVDEVKAYARTVLEPEMKAVVPASGIAIQFKSGFPGLDTPPSSEIVALAHRLSGSDGEAKVAFGTEAGRFALAGIPSVVIGPGSIDQAHKADEYIEVAQLAACGAFLDRLIAHASG
jgi:acetylornithine deacetylase